MPRRPTLSLLLALAAAGLAQASPTDLPERLSDTGLYRAGVAGFSPQYPLWSDAAEKRRWVWLPPGSQIDATRPDAWQFPRGSKFWKEFRQGGWPVETRYLERMADGSWRFASYVWDAGGKEARLAPAEGVSLAMPGLAAGVYEVPARRDCLACHGGAAAPVLGFSALQLSPDRDPLAPGAQAPRPGDLDLPALLARGRLRGLSAALRTQPPRIAAAAPVERAALGYLHANCGHCHHRAGGQVPLTLTLAQRVADPQASRSEVLASTLLAAGRYRPPGSASSTLISPGQSSASVLVWRMQSRHPQQQMPPLGTRVPDSEGLALVSQWIDAIPAKPEETSP